MQHITDCYPKIFKGVHLVMGWSQTVQPDVNSSRLNQFFKSWLVTRRATSVSFLSLPQSGGSGTGNAWPAVAAAVGPSGNEYKYLINETWNNSESAKAPSGDCYIAWTIPFFNDPDNGYYWVEY